MKDALSQLLKTIPTLSRYLLIGGVVVLLSLLYPSASTFEYRYEQNGIWRYPDLSAPFDFAIQKPEAVYEAEVKALRARLYPYFVKDSQLVRLQQLAFESAFLDKLQRIDSVQYGDVYARERAYLALGKGLLRETFQRGVIATDQRLADPSSVINVLVNEETIQRRIARNIPDEVEAERAVNDTLLKSGLQDVEFLFDLMENAIIPNVVYSDSLTQYFHDFEVRKISRSSDKVVKGEVIVRRGNLIDADSYQKLRSLEDLVNAQSDDRKATWVYVGELLLTLLLIGGFTLYLRVFERGLFQHFGQVAFIFLWVGIFSYLAYSIQRIGFIDPLMIPFAIAPIVIKNFYPGTLGFVTYLLITLLGTIFVAEDLNFLLVQWLVGLVILVANVKTRNWSSFFFSMIYLFCAYLLALLALALIREGSLMAIEWTFVGWIALNVVLSLLSYPLVPLMERIFGFTSDVTLLELGSLDRPILRELSIKAPGTLQHSLQVGNLAENAASAIGANALLCKVAALYHDIGKMKNPFHFIENQSGQSPHINLTPLQSAAIIIEHVTEGVKMAKREGLPRVIIDFIHTHHGTTRVSYFYQMHLKAHPDTQVDASAFTYPGMRPQTKEQAVFMMADSIEAAAKSLKNPTAEAIDDLVENIIAGKLKQHQFDEADLTFKELETVKAVFKKLLKSIYHVRIAYPKDND